MCDCHQYILIHVRLYEHIGFQKVMKSQPRLQQSHEAIS